MLSVFVMANRGPPKPSLSPFIIFYNVPITSLAPLVFAKLNSLSLANLSSDGDRAINLITEERRPSQALPGAQRTAHTGAPADDGRTAVAGRVIKCRCCYNNVPVVKLQL